MLWNSTGGRQTQWQATQAAAKQLNLQLYSMQILTADDLENAFKEAAKARVGAVAVTQSSEIGNDIRRVINIIAKHRLPAMYASPEYAEMTGVMAYGSSRTDLASRAATYVDKLL